MRHKNDDAPAEQGQGAHLIELAAHIVPQKRPPAPRFGLIIAVTPGGIVHIDAGRFYASFLRVVAVGWIAFGATKGGRS